MRKSTVILMIAGIVFGLIVIVWQLVPILLEQPLKVTWTDEAKYYHGNYTSTILSMVTAPEGMSTSLQWALEFSEKIANYTDSEVDIIDVRVGMTMVWWEISQSSNPEDRMFPGRYSWDELNISNPPQTAYSRLKDAEGMALDQGKIPEDWIEVDWSFEAIKYYWDPGDPYFDIPDRTNCMIEVLRLEANGNVTEFRAMFGNATAKAEGIAVASDKVVDLQDLRDAIAETILLQYPDRYSD
ncbi:MAG: hypothetical protein ACFFCW_37335, partial [Candidatus Hodarchaeota archaeon]